MLISIHSLTKYNQLKCIVDDVDMVIEDNDKIGLVGINGVGKSTLLRIIAGEEDYQGEIMRKKDLTISFLPQNSSFNKDNTVIEEVYHHIDKTTPEYEITAMLTRFNINDFDQSISELSGGQIKRIALAIALLKPCDLLILDEPTNHLDSDMVEYLEKYLIKRKKALLMVTHDRFFLERVVNRIVEIGRHQLYNYDANYSNYLILKQEREDQLLSSQHKRQRFLKKELAWVKSGVHARTTKQKSRLQRYEQLSSIETIKPADNVEMIKVSSRLGKKIIEMHHLSMAYDKPLFSNFSYTFKQGDRIGILGPNGCGKSTLLNIIAGIILPNDGSIDYGETVKISYFKQNSEDLDDHQRVIDCIKETNAYLVTDEGQLSAKQMCERFLFDQDMQYTYINNLSGGEKRRLYLLKILMEAPNVLLLDEPTNDLDITTLAILEDYLDYFKGIIITVSHDRYFLDRVCDALFIFHNQTIEYRIGGYSEYKEIKDSQIKKSAPRSKTTYKKKVKKLTYQEEREITKLEEKIPENESKIKELEEKMSDVSYDELQLLTAKRDELNKQLEIDNERYIFLLEKQESLQKQ